MNERISNFMHGLVNLLLFVATTLLGLRFILKLFDANATNDFVNWIYQSSAEILGPFRNVFPAPNVEGSIIEFSTLFALIVYGLLAMFFFYLIDWFSTSATSNSKGRRSKRK